MRATRRIDQGKRGSLAVRVALAAAVVSLALSRQPGVAGAAGEPGQPAPVPAPEVTPTTAPSPTLDKTQSAISKLVPLLIAIGAIGIVTTAIESSVKQRRKQKRRTAQARKRATRPQASRGSSRTRPPTRKPRSAPPPSSPTTTLSPDATSEGWSGTPGASARARAEELEREARMWRQGAIGEEKAGRLLDELPEGQWWTFHDLPIGSNGANIDHLVIGVGGVFTVNTKASTGSIWVAPRVFLVNGTKTAYLPKATSEARRVSDRLSSRLSQGVSVWPVLAVDAPNVTVKEPPEDVTVISLADLTSWLVSCPPRLTPQQAYDIVLAAHDRSTWW